MANEVQVKTAQEIATNAMLVDEVFADLVIDKSDIIIPKILLMQPTSGFVAEEKAQLGEFRHSMTGEKVGSILEPMVIIPFHYTKCIDVTNADDGGKLIRKEPFNAQTAQLPREDVEAVTTDKGTTKTKIKRFTRLDFFCLVPTLLASGSSLPCVISFKSTGYKAGSLILTAWSDVQASNIKAKQEGRLADLKLPFSKAFSMGGIKVTNDKKQTYFAPSVQVCGEASAEHQRLALQWLQTLKTEKIVVDASDEKESEHVVVADGTGAF